MLAKDRQYVPMESVKEKGKLVIQDCRRRKKEIKKHTDQAKYFNLLRVLAQSILSTLHKPLPSTHWELKQSALTSAIFGSRNKRPKELETIFPNNKLERNIS